MYIIMQVYNACMKRDYDLLSMALFPNITSGKMAYTYRKVARPLLQIIFLIA